MVFVPFRWVEENLTGSEKIALLILTAVLIWSAAAGIVESFRRPAPVQTEPDLYARLSRALPDPDFYSVRSLQKEARISSPDPFDAAIFLADRIEHSRPYSAGEIEISETGWIFFPRDYYTTLNINTATFRQLQQLPGIGPATARRIIDYRRRYSGFIKPSALVKVTGIGPRTYLMIKDRIRVH